MNGQIGYYKLDSKRRKAKKVKEKVSHRPLAKLILTYFCILLMSVPVAYALGKAGVSIKIPKKIFTFRAY